MFADLVIWHLQTWQGGHPFCRKATSPVSSNASSILVVFNVPFKALNCVGKTSYLLQTPCTLQLLCTCTDKQLVFAEFGIDCKSWAKLNTFICNLLAQYCSFSFFREGKKYRIQHPQKNEACQNEGIVVGARFFKFWVQQNIPMQCK